MNVSSTHSPVLSSEIQFLSHISSPSSQIWKFQGKRGSCFQDGWFEYPYSYVTLKNAVFAPCSWIWKSLTRTAFFKTPRHPSIWTQDPGPPVLGPPDSHQYMELRYPWYLDPGLPSTWPWTPNPPPGSPIRQTTRISNRALYKEPIILAMVFYTKKKTLCMSK